MRCRRCEYRLWNLRSRQCPECGAPFLPSEYEFVPSSVQFCCPHCNRAYYGTGEKGHLVPIEFDCVSCGRHIHMDEMVLLPTAGVEEEQTKVEQNPWLGRKERGRLKGWWLTVRGALFSPARLIEMTPEESSVRQAMWFAALTSLVTSAPIVVLGASLLAPVVVFGLNPFGPAGRMSIFVWLATFVGLVLLFAPLLTLLGIRIWGAVTQGLLRLAGRTSAGSRRTYQAICYSSGANVAGAIPCIGPYLGWVWWLASAVLMVRQAHGVSAVRAALAVLCLPVFLLVLGVGSLVAWAQPWIAASASMAAAATQPAFLQAQIAKSQEEIARSTAQTMTLLIRSYSVLHSDRAPGHAIELLSDPNTMSLFAVYGTGTVSDDIPVAGTTIGQFKRMPPIQRQAVVKATIAAMPKGAVAHRMGDYVFTYHGINLRQPDPNLWLVIVSPDPNSVPLGPAQRNFVGLADERALSISHSGFGARLIEQNELRKRHHLAPLPDPNTVTYGKPAVAGF
jgi:hypothetical protein